jgi:uncharacterized damage-inducible protein DinB
MIKLQKWFERSFDFNLDVRLFPAIVERLRGTPVRLEERVADVSKAVLIERVDDRWSIQEQVGHLLDLEPLWLGRVDDLLAGRAWLRSADLSNRATHEANHNTASIKTLLREFRTVRHALVSRIEMLNTEEVLYTALHPRLEQPMRLIDLAMFVAEHDDHHLATITSLLSMDQG